jgi:hypothetical protein
MIISKKQALYGIVAPATFVGQNQDIDSVFFLLVPKLRLGMQVFEKLRFDSLAAQPLGGHKVTPLL